MFRNLSDCIRRAHCRQKSMDARRAAPAMAIPLPSAATQQTRFLATTRRAKPLRSHGGVAGRLLWVAQRRTLRLALQLVEARCA